MKLEVLDSFSGVLGNAGKGQIITVSAEVGKQMISESYPVAEVKEDGGKSGKSQSNENT